ncbi:MAG: NHL repeat-containing protein [Bryobacteraceae bacterium]|jgi:sugar lactone lactonase YvrE
MRILMEMRPLRAVFLTLFMSWLTFAQTTTPIITTVAGNGLGGYGGDGGPAINAGLDTGGVAVDSGGNLYIADIGNHRIRKVTNGVITTVAGSGTGGFSGDGGPATNAELYFPEGVAVDSAGNLYIADTNNNRTRKVSNGVITTVAGCAACSQYSTNVTLNQAATSVALYQPSGVTVDSAGNLYIADQLNDRVCKVSNGVITTVAGSVQGCPFPGTICIGSPPKCTPCQGYGGDGGPATNAELSQPAGVAVDSAGNLYIADMGNSRIRKVADGVITTIAGNGTYGFGGDNGPAISAEFHMPTGVAVDSASTLYIADTYNNRIRKASNGVITTIAGNGTQGFSGDGGLATNAELNRPFAVVPDSTGNVYIADQWNDRLRILTQPPPPSITAVVNAASFQEGPVSPGEIVTIGGTGLAARGRSQSFSDGETTRYLNCAERHEIVGVG